jgi:type II secretory pathway component PulC
MFGAFGDIDALVHCSTAATTTTCSIEPELFVAVQSNFGLFIDEGIQLLPMELTGIGRGVEISGIEHGGDGAQLLRALGLREEDVITHVDGITVLSPENLERIMLELPTATTWKLTIRRRSGSEWRAMGLVFARA